MPWKEVFFCGLCSLDLLLYRDGVLRCAFSAYCRVQPQPGVSTTNVVSEHIIFYEMNLNQRKCLQTKSPHNEFFQALGANITLRMFKYKKVYLSLQ